MTVLDVINHLKNGELRQIAVRDDVSTIISYINMGVLEIYKRFNLLEKEVLIDLEDNITTYSLPDDVIKIEAIYDENGDWFHLNDENDALSIFTPTYNTIQVPNPATGSTLSVIYSAEPTSVVLDTDVVQLPAQYLEALLLYIGYRAYSSISANQNEQNNMYYLRFEASIKRIIDLGLINYDEVPINQNYLRNLV